MQAAVRKQHCGGTSKATVLLAQLRFWHTSLLHILAFSADAPAALLPILRVLAFSPRLLDTHMDSFLVWWPIPPTQLFLTFFSFLASMSFPIPAFQSLHCPCQKDSITSSP